MHNRENTTKVFVGSLPEGVTTDDLRQLFAPYGAIAECDIGGNRCGFLHLEDKELALKAIQELHNTTLKGVRITVELGRVKPPRRKDGRGKRDRGKPYIRNNRELQGAGIGYPDRGYLPYERYGEYDRAMPPAPPRGYGTEYDGIGNRRPAYGDRRDYMDDGRGYMTPTGAYDRRYDDRPPYPPMDRSAYDDRRMPPGGPMTGYDDRRSLLGDRRGLLDQGPARSATAGYDRSYTATDMYSRRDTGPKSSMMPPPPAAGTYGSTYGTASVAAPAYGNGTTARDSGYTTATGYETAATGYPASTPAYTAAAATGYSTVGYTSYSTATPGTGNGYGASTAGYSSTTGGYSSTTGGYTSTATGYSSTGYGDTYGNTRAATAAGTYDTSYTLPPQRGFS